MTSRYKSCVLRGVLLNYARVSNHLTKMPEKIRNTKYTLRLNVSF